MFKIYEPYGDVEIHDLIEYENLNELVGKKLKLIFEIKEAEGLPKKLQSRTFCNYEFFHTSGEKYSEEEQAHLESIDFNFDDDDDFQYPDDDGSGEKRVYKSFRTKEVEKKTATPGWDYKMSHTLTIDDELLYKF